jgi:YD repeat-containing protein
MYSGVKKLTSIRETQYSSANPAKSTSVQTDYYYNNLNSNHQQLSRRVTLDSDGSTQENYYWYAADYLNIGEIIPLQTKNIVGVPIKEELHRNGQIISGKVNRLNSDGKPYEVYQYETAVPATPPTHHVGTVIPTGYSKRLDISYDGTTKNINKTQLLENTKTTYLWGYNSEYPVAMVANAEVNDVAATSFESDGKGNWNYNGPVYSNITVKTGIYYYRLGGGSVTKSLSPGKYRLEYWAKGTVNVSGGTITAIATSAADADGWKLYEKEVNVTSTVTLTLSGSSTAYVDELRVYPVTAQMTTYTYDVAFGISSVTDANNVVTYYVYDALGRLQLVKDQHKNIVKANEYHYKGF